MMCLSYALIANTHNDGYRVLRLTYVKSVITRSDLDVRHYA